MKNCLNMLLHIELNWERRDICGSSDADRHTPNPSALRIKPFIHQLGNMTENIIVALSLDDVTIQNKFPGVFEVQDFLHVCRRHASDPAVLNDFFCLRK